MLFCCYSANTAQGQAGPINYKPGTVIFKLLPEYRTALEEISPKNFQFTDAVLQELCEAQGAYSVKLLYPHHRGRKAGLVDLSLVGELQFAADADVLALCRQLKATGRFQYTEPRFLFKKDGYEERPQQDYARRQNPVFLPNDSLVSEQWHLDKIKAFDAWEIEQGDTSIMIGIVDDGVDYTHPDLAANIALNHADPVNGIDDDDNGFVDDYLGWDLYYNDNDPAPAGGHGTGVAGIATAVTNNGIGIASPGFNSRILAIKGSSDDPNDTNISYGYEGIIYAADRGCRVINCSWGGTFGEIEDGYLADIINYATFDKNALVVAAAGNNNNTQNFYPAYAKHIVAVASIDSADVKKPISNFNYKVDIAAQSGVWATSPGGLYYGNFGGTSAASPVVAGAAALLAAYDTSLSAIQLSERLRLTADNIDAQNPNYVEQLGRGRLNMHRSLTDPATPAVRFTNAVFTDGNDEFFTEGDTLRLSGDFVNYLADVGNVAVTASTPNAGVVVLDNSFIISSLSSMGTVTNDDEPFTFVIGAGIPPDAELDIRLGFEAANYSDWQWVSVPVNRTRLNITTGVVSTTIFANGNMGYSNNPYQGIGIQYHPDSKIDGEFGLMLGSSTTRVSDAAFQSWAGNFFSADFQTTETVHPMPPPLDASMAMTCAYNDSALFLPIYRMDVSVRQNAYAWAGDPFIITEYEITNHGLNTYPAFYVGLWSDVLVALYLNNRVEQDSTLKLGYAYCTVPDFPYLGIQLLGQDPFNLYAIESTPDFGSVDITNTFSSPEKYTTLTQSRPSGGFGDADGDNISMVVSTGPVFLAPGNTVKVAFSILAADGLEELRSAAENALTRYDQLSINTTTTAPGQTQSLNIFPNPAGDVIWIETRDWETSRPAMLELYDMSGNKISGFYPIPEGGLWRVSTAHLPAGIYVLRAQTDLGVQTGKFVKNPLKTLEGVNGKRSPCHFNGER